MAEESENDIEPIMRIHLTIAEENEETYSSRVCQDYHGQFIDKSL